MSKIVEEFSTRLKKALEIRNLKAANLAEKTGINKANISYYISGKYKAKQDILHTLAKALNVEEAWLMGYNVPMEKKEDKKIKKIPVLGKIPAGIPVECIEEIIDYEELAITTNDTRDYFALKIDGESMYPLYTSGDIIICIKTPTCESGQDCVVMINGDDATFKRVYINENGLTLQPLNPKFEPKFFSKDQIEKLPVKILGVAKEIRRKL